VRHKKGEIILALDNPLRIRVSCLK